MPISFKVPPGDKRNDGVQTQRERFLIKISLDPQPIGLVRFELVEPDDLQAVNLIDQRQRLLQGLHPVGLLTEFPGLYGIELFQCIIAELVGELYAGEFGVRPIGLDLFKFNEK